MANIFEEIKAERARQDKQWGGPEHDDQHMPYRWFEFIRKQIRRYTPDAKKYSGFSSDDLVKVIRARLVRIAALAVAGIESIDRKTK